MVKSAVPTRLLTAYLSPPRKKTFEYTGLVWFLERESKLHRPSVPSKCAGRCRVTRSLWSEYLSTSAPASGRITQDQHFARDAGIGDCLTEPRGSGHERRAMKSQEVPTAAQQGKDSRPPDWSRDGILTSLAAGGDHALMHAFPQGAVFAFDGDLRYLSAGGLGLADVGLSPASLEGKTIFEAFAPGTSSMIEPYYRAALRGESTTWDVPFEGRIYSQRLAPITDETGAVVAGLGFTQDVTEARALEQALREAEQRTGLTFEHAPIGQAIVELDGRWRQVNAALIRLIGYSEDRLLQMTFQDITHPDDLDLDLDHLSKLIAGHVNSYQIEKRYFTSDGGIVWVWLSVALVRDGEGSPLYFIAQIEDITERKHQQQALHDLTAMLAHDLRTPATVIRGFAELLTAETDLSDDQRKNYTNRIGSAARSMTMLLENALTAATLKTGQLQPKPEQVAVSSVVHDLIRDLAGATALDVDLSGLGDNQVWIDRVHLVQVLGNLVTNAIKYGGDRVTIASHTDGDDVVLSIADRGPGVEPDFAPHLFERHTRSTAAHHSEQRGSGLGLYIVRNLLTVNGGAIDYAPRRGGGAEFTLRLPRDPRSAA